MTDINSKEFMDKAIQLAKVYYNTAPDGELVQTFIDWTETLWSYGEAQDFLYGVILHQQHLNLTEKEVIRKSHQNFNTEDIMTVEQRDNNYITYLDENDKLLGKVYITKIETREEAIKLCKDKTINALKLPDAYENLKSFENDFTKHRNYELETYLERITGILGYRIVEVCPFNGFSGLVVFGKERQNDK